VLASGEAAPKGVPYVLDKFSYDGQVDPNATWVTRAKPPE
jgi:hypothetical protein